MLVVGKAQILRLLVQSFSALLRCSSVKYQWVFALLTPSHAKKSRTNNTQFQTLPTTSYQCQDSNLDVIIGMESRDGFSPRVPFPKRRRMHVFKRKMSLYLYISRWTEIIQWGGSAKGGSVQGGSVRQFCPKRLRQGRLCPRRLCPAVLSKAAPPRAVLSHDLVQGGAISKEIYRLLRL